MPTNVTIHHRHFDFVEVRALQSAGIAAGHCIDRARDASEMNPELLPDRNQLSLYVAVDDGFLVLLVEVINCVRLIVRRESPCLGRLPLPAPHPYSYLSQAPSSEVRFRSSAAAISALCSVSTQSSDSSGLPPLLKPPIAAGHCVDRARLASACWHGTLQHCRAVPMKADWGNLNSNRAWHGCCLH